MPPQRHTVNALNSSFVISHDFQFVKELGQGAYGAVIATKNVRSGDGCAIKKVTNINSKVSYYRCALMRCAASLTSFVRLAEDLDEEMFERDEVRKLYAVQS